MPIKRPEGGEHHEPPTEKQIEQKEPEKPVQEILEEWIEFPRVNILRENDETFTVEYNGEEITISKEEMKHEMGAFHAGSGSPAMQVRLEIRQELQPLHGLFLDRDIPTEFREALIFHELREKEYSGFEDAHQRAVHDEILYVLKHFSPELRKQYLEFAEKEREEKSPQMEIDPEELLQLLEANGLEVGQGNLEEDEHGKLFLPETDWLQIHVGIKGKQTWALLSFDDIQEGYVSIQIEPYSFEPEIVMKYDNRNSRTLKWSVSKIAEKAKALLETGKKQE